MVKEESPSYCFQLTSLTCPPPFFFVKPHFLCPSRLSSSLELLTITCQLAQLHLLFSALTMGGWTPLTGNINKGLWTPEEDRHLIMLMREYDGVRKIKWTRIANRIGNRVGKQCRERWHNHLRPDIKKDNWSREEELLLVEAHQKVGNKWSKLAKMIPSRSENTIKNHWNSIKRQLLSKLSSPRRIHWTRKGHSVLRDYILSIIDPSYTPPPSSLSPPPSSSKEVQVPTNAYENGGLPSQLTQPALSYHFQNLIMQYRCPYCYSTLPQGLTRGEVNHLPIHDDNVHEQLELQLPTSLDVGYACNGYFHSLLAREKLPVNID